MAHQLGIVGSGAIACGLARAAAEHHEVVVWARSERSAERAGTRVEGARVVTDLEALAGCDIVVEAVAEDAAVKSDLHQRLGQLLPEHTVLATTTSSLSVSDLARRYPISFAAVHKHVGTLERAGLVTKTRHGREQRVRGDVATLRSAHGLLDDLEALWRGRMDRIEQVLADPIESAPR